jgi:hypothetical protein
LKYKGTFYKQRVMKDWIGNKNSIYTTLGASNHTDKEREQSDYYATDPIAVELLLKEEDFSTDIWECASGENHLADALKEHGHNVRTSDIVKRTDTTEQYDFLSIDNTSWHGDIITNPPYRLATEFIYKSLSIINNGNKVAMFLKVQFMEGKERKHLFTNFPPKVIYVSSSRIMCAKNGDFDKMKKGGGSAVAYAWYVWEKGYKGNTIVKWIN